MSVHIEEKVSFTVIGKVGQGLSAEGHKWIPALWQEANSKFDEIRNLEKTDSSGNPVGFWGAMSDVSESFKPWAEQGLYLAGCEVFDHSVAPIGWTKWVIPSFKYAVIKCNQTTYQEKFRYMIHEYLPENNYTLVGAVHEYYTPIEINGNLCLYFPIEKKNKR
ncbi:GyrI-like domain-containing protein [Cohnella hongkongensis]|uniref:GyrI-like domain-containing protein n=1 Tax=Cohnella hongkongensis TaxID=178337 RepID=A0ABV9FJD5_9BACL